MSILFAASYVLLVSVVVLEGFVLYGVLQEVRRALELDARNRKSEATRYREAVLGIYEAKPGRAPEFSARLLDSADLVNSATILGHTSALLFANPACPALHRPHVFLSVVHALLHKVDSLYVVCRGTENACRALRDETLLSSLTVNAHIIVDAQNDLASTFGVREDHPPSAVLIDERGFTLKSGSMSLQSLISA
jgi:hypothetical protein